MSAPASNVVSREEAALLPALVGDVVVLRPLGPAHTDALFEAADSSKAEIGVWLPWCHPGYTRKEAVAFAESRARAWSEAVEYTFAIFAAEDEPTARNRKAMNERFVGVCALNELHPVHRAANLGYWIRTSATGNGYASTAARALARFGLLHLGLRRIEIVAAVENLPSRRAAEKSGAAREGVLRHRLCLRGTSHDAVVFSFVRADFGIADEVMEASLL